MSTATMNLTQSIAAAVLANPAAVTAMDPKPVLCGYCDKPLGAEDLAHLAEMGGDVMCSSCAEMAQDTVVDKAEVVEATPDLAAMQAELEKLRAEHAALTANRATNPGISGTSSQNRSTILENKALSSNASQSALRTSAAALPDPSTFTKADIMLLKLIDKFKTSPDKIKAGVVPGTYAVKVHSYLHAAGIPEATIREAIDSAFKRNVISKLAIPTRTGKNMMLYFDARLRPNTTIERDAISAAEKAAAKDAFGL